MPDFKNQFGRAAKKVVRRRYDEHVLKNVISLRISDEELAMLTHISKTTSKSVSEIMREAFKSWQANCRQRCLDM